MPRKRPSRDSASKVWRKLRPTWTTGRSAGPTRAFTAPPNGRWRPCSPKRSPRLLPLPLEPFRYYQYGKRTVNLDGCVEVDAAYYSAPPGWIGQAGSGAMGSPPGPPAAPADRRTVAGTPAARCAASHRIKDEDRPKHTPPGIQHLLLRADRAGQQIGVAVPQDVRGAGASRRAPHSGRAGAGQEAWRRRWWRRPAPWPWKSALRNYYRFVRRYLERRPQLPLSLRQVDPLIRELT